MCLLVLLLIPGWALGGPAEVRAKSAASLQLSLGFCTVPPRSSLIYFQTWHVRPDSWSTQPAVPWHSLHTHTHAHTPNNNKDGVGHLRNVSRQVETFCCFGRNRFLPMSSLLLSSFLIEQKFLSFLLIIIYNIISIMLLHILCTCILKELLFNLV